MTADTVADLHLHLEHVPDPRGRRGARYPAAALLATAAAAVLAGAKSLLAIGEWAADAPQHVLARLGYRPDPLTGIIRPPHGATLRRLLVRADGDALDTAIGRYLLTRQPPGPAPQPRPTARRAIAVDGKTLRGSRTPDRPAIALLAAMDHTGSVLAQRQVADKSNEIPAFRPLLDTLDLEQAVITADALHTQHGHGAYLRERGAHYLAVVKKNHPGLHQRISRLPWQDIALDHYDRTRAHHRDEIRRLKTARFDHIDYPGARQALQVVRWRREKTKSKLTIERVYLITSLEPGQADGAQLAAWIRGHWASRTSCTTSATAPTARTTPRSAPGNCPGPWPASATSPSAYTARTATPTSPPPSATPAATTTGPYPPSDSPDEPGQNAITQCPWSG
ncbi:ISAs1 family transposase [Streptomyces sp. ISL-43]|uniref:ISAs1 family transposase n=1 Tax=Streptomyces sp. ISL-43 TaxID=2819183 RepID=UPI0020352D3B|nr:ISAs1 family transposase [Streptomyces sp. ISL-43]